MRGGRLNRLVEIQKPTETQTSTGHPTKTWATVAKVWAGIEPAKATESESAGELISVQKTLIPIRYSSQVAVVDETYRVKAGSRIFSIEHATLPTARLGSTAEIQLNCIEGKKDGG